MVVSAILSPELFGSPISAEFAIEAGRPCRIGGKKKRGVSELGRARGEQKKTQSKVRLGAAKVQ